MTDIPDGYSYIRCDRYKPEDFTKMYREGYMRDVCEEYVRKHPKEWYDTNDEIAIHTILESRRVNRLLRHTTKRYQSDLGNR